VSDLYSPATGTVTAINEELTTAPEKINADAHSAWIMKIELADPSEVDSLLTAQDYEAYVKEETGH
ncbi:MAG: glycine cleavage system protein H, partial [Acidobacteriaceae bacterium]